MPIPIKFDPESLERLVNESYIEILDEHKDLNDKIEKINELEEQSSPGLILQQYGEVYTRIVEAKGRVSERKLRLTQLVKDIYKMQKQEKDEGTEKMPVSADRLNELAEEFEESRQQREKEEDEEEQERKRSR
jgi:hypothetical protein